MYKTRTLNIFGFDIATIKRENLLKELKDLIQIKKSLHICCLNPHSYVISKKDKAFERALKTSDLVVPDGIGVCLALKAIYKKKVMRITGYDLFEELLHLSNQERKNIYFLGSHTDTLKALQKKVTLEFPLINIVGVYSPPFVHKFDDSHNAIINNEIHTAAPDIVFVSLSAPKQETWVYENLSNHENTTFVSIGAVFDFYTGKVKRSNKIFRSIGLEWLPRLAQQPRRLWKRTFISAPIFIIDVFRIYKKIIFQNK